MFRSRLLSFLLATSLLTSCGCCICWPERPWFGRRCCNNGCGNNGSGGLMLSEGETFSSEGPILMDGGQGTILGQPPGTQTTEPQMAPMPRRLAPVPSAQPLPFVPMNRT